MSNQINQTTPANQSLISQYQQYLINQSKSDTTIKSYVGEVSHFLSLHNQLSRSTILEYKKQMSNLSLSTGSFNHRLSSLKSFNEFLITINQASTIHIIKQDFIKTQAKGNPTELTDAQVSKYLKRVATKPHTYRSRNMAIINLIINTGIRREEVTKIKLRHLDLESGYMTVIGKGNKERTAILNDHIISVLESYLQDRQNYKRASSEYLFVSAKSDKIHKDYINDIFDFYSTPKCKINPHELRHYFATLTQEQNIYELHELQNQLGHSSLATTGVYTQARKSNMKKKINNLKIG